MSSVVLPRLSSNFYSKDDSSRISFFFGDSPRFFFLQISSANFLGIPFGTLRWFFSDFLPAKCSRHCFPDIVFSKIFQGFLPEFSWKFLSEIFLKFSSEFSYVFYWSSCKHLFFNSRKNSSRIFFFRVAFRIIERFFFGSFLGISFGIVPANSANDLLLKYSFNLSRFV